MTLLSRHLNSDSCVGFVKPTFQFWFPGTALLNEVLFWWTMDPKRPFMAGEWTLNLIFCYQKSRKLEKCILRKRYSAFLLSNDRKLSCPLLVPHRKIQGYPLKSHGGKPRDLFFVKKIQGLPLVIFFVKKYKAYPLWFIFGKNTRL